MFLLFLLYNQGQKALIFALLSAFCDIFLTIQFLCSILVFYGIRGNGPHPIMVYISYILIYGISSYRSFLRFSGIPTVYRNQSFTILRPCEWAHPRVSSRPSGSPYACAHRHMDIRQGTQRPVDIGFPKGYCVMRQPDTRRACTAAERRPAARTVNTDGSRGAAKHRSDP